MSEMAFEDQTSRIDYRRWGFDVISWDGLLPVLVIVLPGIAIREGAHREFTEVLGYLLPLGAFIIRMGLGMRHVMVNKCGEGLKVLQFFSLTFAAILLILFDTLLLLSGEMKMFRTLTDVAVAGTIYGVYLACMILVMYPGRK